MLNARKALCAAVAGGALAVTTGSGAAIAAPAATKSWSATLGEAVVGGSYSDVDEIFGKTRAYEGELTIDSEECYVLVAKPNVGIPARVADACGAATLPVSFDLWAGGTDLARHLELCWDSGGPFYADCAPVVHNKG